MKVFDIQNDSHYNNLLTYLRKNDFCFEENNIQRIVSKPHIQNHFQSYLRTCSLCIMARVTMGQKGRVKVR